MGLLAWILRACSPVDPTEVAYLRTSAAEPPLTSAEVQPAIYLPGFDSGAPASTRSPASDQPWVHLIPDHSQAPDYSGPGRRLSILLRVPDEQGRCPPADLHDSLTRHATHGATTAAVTEREVLACLGRRHAWLAHPPFPQPAFLPTAVYTECCAFWKDYLKELIDLVKTTTAAVKLYREYVNRASYSLDYLHTFLKAIESKAKDLVHEAERRFVGFKAIPHGPAIDSPFEPESDAEEELAAEEAHAHPVVFSKFYRLLPLAPPNSLHDFLCRAQWARTETRAASCSQEDPRNPEEDYDEGEDGRYDRFGPDDSHEDTDAEAAAGLIPFPIRFPEFLPESVPPLVDRLAHHLASTEIGTAGAVQPGGPPGDIPAERHPVDSEFRPAALAISGIEDTVEPSSLLDSDSEGSHVGGPPGPPGDDEHTGSDPELLAEGLQPPGMEPLLGSDPQ